ncbi:hypothetical protein GCM10010254_29370 [Streptomyces chromofuscus]|nr:hypothetical protein GCM10010254_29370 [Streptomyces chromofuscus]
MSYGAGSGSPISPAREASEWLGALAGRGGGGNGEGEGCGEHGAEEGGAGPGHTSGHETSTLRTTRTPARADWPVVML